MKKRKNVINKIMSLAIVLAVLVLNVLQVQPVQVKAADVVTYEPIEYVELDCKQYQNFKIGYYIPSKTTSYTWEITLSDLEKNANSRGSFMGIYTSGYRSGYFFSENATSTEPGHVGERFFQVCAGSNHTGTKFYLFNKGKNTITASYTSNGTSINYSVYDTLGLVASSAAPNTGSISGTYAWGPSNVFGITSCATYDSISSMSEFCSMKLYGIRIWDNSTGSKGLRVDIEPVQKLVNGQVVEVGLHDKVKDTFIGFQGYTNLKKITLNNQGATSAGTTSINAVKDMPLTTITPPEKTGYTFEGYYTAPNGAGTQVFSKTGTPTLSKWTSSTDTTIYAKWAHIHVYGSEGESRYICSCGYRDNVKHLVAVKADAKAAIDAEVGTDTSENVKEAADAAKAAIDAATNLDDVSDELEEGIAKIAELQHKNVLDELKRIAKEEIDDEVGTDTSENVKEAAEAAKAAIDAATTKEEIEAATDNGINAIEAAKEVNYRHKVEQEAAKAAIDAEVDGDTTPEIVAAANEAKAAIDAASDLKTISDAKLEGIAKIAELKHLNVLEEVKKAAKVEIDLVVGTDTTETVKEAAEAAKAAIDAATTIEEVEAATDKGIELIEVAKALNAGKIENKTNPEENFGGADVELNVIEIVEKFDLTEEELVRVENGEDIHVKLEVKAEEADNIVAAEKEVIEKKLESGEVIGQYLDVNLFKIVGTDKSKITNTNGTITIEITIPSEIKKAGTDYFIVRVHNGVAEKLALTPVSGDTYSFETDRFSTYAIGYKTAASVEAPQTGDASNMALWMIMMMAAFVIMGATFVAKKRA